MKTLTTATAAQRMKQEAINKLRIKEVCPNVDERSGIYIFLRRENGFNYAYVGQAKNLLNRLAQHLKGYQHIDLSIKKHGLYNADANETGWKINIKHCDGEELNKEEQEYIRHFASMGYQLYNHTTGSQDGEKRALGETKSPKGYFEGLARGRNNAIKEIKHLFDLHLKAVYKADKPSKNAEKAMRKFNEIIGDNENDI